MSAREFTSEEFLASVALACGQPRRRHTDGVTDAEQQDALEAAFPACAPCDGQGGWWTEGRFGEVWAVCATCEGFGVEDAGEVAERDPLAKRSTS